MPIDGKSKTTKKITCWLFTKNRSRGKKELDWCWTREIFFLRVWSIEESNISSSSFTTNASKRRRSGSFLEIWKKIFRINSTIYLWSDDRWKACLAERGKIKIPVLYWWLANNCLFRSSSRTHRRQSYWPFIQGQCCYSEQLLPAYLPYWMCAQSAFYHQQWIDTWKSAFKLETDSILPACWSMDKQHQDLDAIDLNVPRHAQYLHNEWKRHQDAENLVDINLAIKKGWTFYQTRSNAIILQETLPAHCILKSWKIENWRSLDIKIYMSPRPPPKIS